MSCPRVFEGDTVLIPSVLIDIPSAQVKASAETGNDSTRCLRISLLCLTGRGLTTPYLSASTNDCASTLLLESESVLMAVGDSDLFLLLELLLPPLLPLLLAVARLVLEGGRPYVVTEEESGESI